MVYVRRLPVVTGHFCFKTLIIFDSCFVLTVVKCLCDAAILKSYMCTFGACMLLYYLLGLFACLLYRYILMYCSQYSNSTAVTSTSLLKVRFYNSVF